MWYRLLDQVEVDGAVAGVVPVVDHALGEALVEAGGQLRAVGENGNSGAEFKNENDGEERSVLINR